VKLRKTLAIGKGYEQLNRDEALPDQARDPRAKLIQTLARFGRDHHRVSVAEGELAALRLVE